MYTFFDRAVSVHQSTWLYLCVIASIVGCRTDNETQLSTAPPEERARSATTKKRETRTGEQPVAQRPKRQMKKQPRPTPVRGDLSASGIPPMGRDAQRLAADRKALDETVWADEVQAQRYEQVVVSLWDDLRTSDDWVAPLHAFDFNTLSWPTPSKMQSLELGIERIEMEGAKHTVTSQEWRTQLSTWKNAGYALEQSEWHHGHFQPAQAQRPAQSSFNIVLHITRGANERIILTGEMKISWSDHNANPSRVRPQSIELSKLKVMRRLGPPAFSREIIAEGVAPAVPLLVHDMDGNGFADIVMPLHDLWYRNIEGRLRPERLFRHRPGQVTSGILADFNGDRLIDLAVGVLDGPALLYIANEEGRYAQRPITLPTGQQKQASAITAGDIDNDGDLDIWITQYKPAYVGGQMPTPYFDSNDGFPATLLRNEGGGRFRDITTQAGLAAKRNRRTYSSSFVDLDGDDDLDLMVVSDFAGVDVYRNNGQGQFTDISQSTLPTRNTFGMAHSFGDYDGDGKLDVFVTGMSSTTARRLSSMKLNRKEYPNIQKMRSVMGYGNRIYRATTVGFEDAKFSSDIARSGWSWGTATFDLENDGDSDVYVANGHISATTAKDYCSEFWRHDIYTQESKETPVLNEFFMHSIVGRIQNGVSWNGFEHNHLFLNRNGPSFTNIAFLLGVADERDSRSVVATDFDNDGRVDILVSVSPKHAGAQTGHELRLFRNRLQTKHHWIGVRLTTGRSRRSPIGAQVTITLANGRKRIHRIVTGDSFLAQHPATSHFGLGDEQVVRAIDVKWPDGHRVRVQNPKINQYHTIPDT